jgi:hypothetical protein
MDLAMRNGAPVIGFERLWRRAHSGRRDVTAGYAEDLFCVTR